VPQEIISPSGSDDGFQKLLLRIASEAAERTTDGKGLIEFFCRATREFLQVSGVYFWRCRLVGDLVGEQANGKMSESFLGLQIRANESAVTADAVRERRTIFANHLNAVEYPAAVEMEARSILAAPLLVSKEVVGAVTFLHDSDENFFNQDLAAKATILVEQLGRFLEAGRSGKVSQEEHRRAEILADVVQVLHGTPDVSSVIEALADRLRILLRTRLVCVLLRRE